MRRAEKALRYFANNAGCCVSFCCDNEGRAAVQKFISLAFLTSGFSALLYQIVWQRELAAIFGVNVESLSVVLAAFMLGLGLGSLIGGFLSRTPALSMLRAFALIEVCIGLFGFISLPLFRAIGRASLRLSPFATWEIMFIMTLTPTILMGATLPILVTYWVNRSGQVGKAVGELYFVNTLGSAIAAFVGVMVLLPWLGAAATTYLAATLNLTVGLGMLLLQKTRVVA